MLLFDTFFNSSTADALTRELLKLRPIIHSYAGIMHKFPLGNGFFANLLDGPSWLSFISLLSNYFAAADYLVDALILTFLLD